MMPSDRLPYGASVVDDLVLPGKSIGRYLVDRQVHLTLLGALYYARDQQQGEDVCLHVLPRFFSADELLPVRLQQMIRRTQQCGVKGILRPSHIEHIEGKVVIVYEGTNGQSVTDYVLHREGPVPEAEVFPILDRVAAIVEEAGGKGVSHYALAPENVLLGPRGEVSIVGFGLLEALDRAHLDQFISSVIVPIRERSVRAYFTLMEVMSPEMRSRGAVDIRSEIYSIGILADFLLSGKKGQPPALALPEVQPALHRKWCSWLERCLHEVSTKRYATLAALRKDLATLRSSGRMHHAVKFSSMQRCVLYAIATLVVASLVGFWAWRWFGHADVSSATQEITIVHTEPAGETQEQDDLPPLLSDSLPATSVEPSAETVQEAGKLHDSVPAILPATLHLRPILPLAELLEERVDLLNIRVGDKTFSGLSHNSLQVPPGEYRVQVDHPDFKPLETVISVAESEILVLDLSLDPLPARLQLQLPDDRPSVVLHNGNLLRNPHTAFNLEPGVRAEITVQPQNHMAVVYSIVPRPNQRLQWTVPLLVLPGPEKGEPWMVPGLGLAMVWLEAGEFVMGSPLQEVMRLPNEGPQTRVTISSPFWMSSHEVSQAQFTRLMPYNPSAFRGPLLPVDSISWDEAVAFTHKLTERERLAGRLPDGFVYRLPTEAEWEFAARAGTTTPFSLPGPVHAGVANVQGGYPPQRTGTVAIASGVTQSLPVGSFAPNPWGLFDMHGNVREWVLDGFTDRLPGGQLTSPLRPGSDHQPRVTRGGSWAELAHRSRSAARDKLSPGARDSAQGFRIVLAPER